MTLYRAVISDHGMDIKEKRIFVSHDEGLEVPELFQDR